MRSYKKSEAVTHELYKADIDPSGMFVVVTGFDKSINIFDFFSGNLITRMMGHSEVVTNVKFTRDGRRILSVSGDGNVLVLRVADGLVNAMQERLADLHGQAERDMRKSHGKLSLPVKSDNSVAPPPAPVGGGREVPCPSPACTSSVCSCAYPRGGF